jgi:transcriptional regulator with XRE-family HTH domain
MDNYVDRGEVCNSFSVCIRCYAKDLTMTSAPATKFQHNLKELRTNKGLSQSDLARLILGTQTDARGYEVARNRDRISAYERGRASPEEENLEKIAEALGVSASELAPELSGQRGRNAPATVTMRVLEGGVNVHLEVNTITTLAIASQVIAMLSEDDPA